MKRVVVVAHRTLLPDHAAHNHRRSSYHKAVWTASSCSTNRPASAAHAVALVKRLLPRKTKIGHAGTLDPFATGVLLLLIGRATKSCERLMDQPKTYESTVKLGATTETDDPESPEMVTPDASIPTIDQVREALVQFVGPIQQRPPKFSTRSRSPAVARVTVCGMGRRSS